jgi:thiol-disulfide isomerase/thioredoxin
MAPALFLYLTLVDNVRTLIAQHDLAAAERSVRAYQKQSGSTPESAAALSWLARGSLEARQLDRADAYAIETRALSDRLLRTRKLDADPWLPTAVGAAVEVHAQVLAARGERADAVAFLRQQLAQFGTTSLHERIQKDINLLSLEGKPAPPLEEAEWLASKPVPLAALRGHPVLLFFWAHWCGDCKAQVAILAEIRKLYAPRGLVLIAPTRYYGYAAHGADAAPPVEKQYIETVRRQYYAVLGDVPVPLSNGNFLQYGASTTPTLVLLDAAGVVRFYHPGAVSGPELATRIQAVLDLHGSQPLVR